MKLSIYEAFVSAALVGFVGAASAQSSDGTMRGGSMGGIHLNANGGIDIFSRQDMAMMILDREKATKDMTPDQIAAARSEEMAKDGAETPEQRQARKAKYDAEWVKLTPAERAEGLTKWQAQLAQINQRGMAPSK